MNFASLTPVLMTRLKKGRRYSPVGTIVKGWCAFVLGVLQINRKEAIPMSLPTSMELAMRYQVGFTAHEEATVELKELVEASDRSTNWAADHTLDVYCAQCTGGPGTNEPRGLWLAYPLRCRGVTELSTNKQHTRESVVYWYSI